MKLDLICKKDLAIKLGMREAVKVPGDHPQVLYFREIDSIMTLTGLGMFVWPLDPLLLEELKIKKK
jgi:hypothetical protein